MHRLYGMSQIWWELVVDAWVEAWPWEEIGALQSRQHQLDERSRDRSLDAHMIDHHLGGFAAGEGGE